MIIQCWHGGKFRPYKPDNKYFSAYYFSSNEKVAATYGDIVYKCQITVKHGLTIDAKNNWYIEIPLPRKLRKLFGVRDMSTDDLACSIRREFKDHYNCIRIENVIEGNGNQSIATDYILLDDSYEILETYKVKTRMDIPYLVKEDQLFERLLKKYH